MGSNPTTSSNNAALADVVIAPHLCIRWGRDREKMDIVLKTYPDKNIVIVEKEQYERFLEGELVW